MLILALAAEAAGGPERAARLFGAPELLRETAGTRRLGVDEDVVAGAVKRAREALGEELFAFLHAEGRGLSVGEATALALTDEARPS